MFKCVPIAALQTLKNVTAPYYGMLGLATLKARWYAQNATSKRLDVLNTKQTTCGNHDRTHNSHSSYLDRLDDGEAESLAFFLSSQDDYLISSADIIVFKVLGRLALELDVVLRDHG